MRATRVFVGIALLGAAGASALVSPRGVSRRGRRSNERAPVEPRVAWLAAAALLAAVREFERGAMGIVQVTGGLARTTVNVARLSPMGPWVDDASAHIRGWSSRGRAEGEVGMERVTDVWEALLGEVARRMLRHVDLNELVASVDVDALAARVDVQSLLDRVDLDAIARRVDEHGLDRPGIARTVPEEAEVETAFGGPM